MKKIRPLWRWLTFCLIGLIVLVFAGNIIINRVIEGKLKQQLGALQPYAHVSFSTAKVNLFAFSLQMQGVTVVVYPDTLDKQHAHTLHFTNADVSGINFFKILFSKKAGISTVKLSGGNIVLDSVMLYRKDLPHYNVFASLPFTQADLSHLAIPGAQVYIKGDTKTSLLSGSVYVDDIHVQQAGASNVSFGDVSCTLQNIQYTLPGIQHTVQVKSLNISSSKKTVMVDSLTVMPVSVKNDTIPVTIKAVIPAIFITGLDMQKLQAGELLADDISIEKSDLHISFQSPFKKIKLPAQAMKAVKINTIAVKDATLNCSLNDGVDDITSMPLDSLLPGNVAINDVSVSAAKLLIKQDGKREATIDSLDISGIQKTAGKSAGIKAIYANISKISGAVPIGYNTVHIGSVRLNSEKQTLHISDIKLTPQYGKYELGNKLGRQADYIESTVGSVSITGFNVPQLLHKKLVADNITVNKCNAYIFRDRRLPRQNRTQLLPVAFLESLPLDLNVKKVEMKNSSVAYEEYPKDGNQTGTLKIVSLNTSMWPLVNHGAGKVQFMQTHIQGSIMGSGSIEGDIFMPLSPAEDYQVTGEINNLELTQLNSTAENLGKFHVESGMLNNLTFKFGFNNQKAHGKIVGEYHNLVLEKLKGDDKKVAAIPTFALKNIIIPKNKDKSLPERRRTGIIRYDYDPTRFFSYYLVKSLLSGIRDSFTLGFVLPK